MDVYDAILRSVIEGNSKYGKIFSRARKITEMSKMTFTNNLKILTEDGLILRKDLGKQNVLYKIDPKKNRLIKKIIESPEINRIIKENNQALDPNFWMMYPGRGHELDDYLEELVQMFDKRIQRCIIKINYLMIVSNSSVVKTKTEIKKATREIKKLEKIIGQSLRILDVFAPEIRKDYETYLMLKFHKRLNDFETKTWPKSLKGSNLVEKLERRYKKK